MNRKRIICENLKYFGIWLPIVILINISEVVSIIYCINIGNFTDRWFELIEPLKDSYSCTSESFWIDIDAIKAEYEGSALKSNVKGIIIISMIKLVITWIQFISHYILVIRFYKDC